MWLVLIVVGLLRRSEAFNHWIVTEEGKIEYQVQKFAHIPRISYMYPNRVFIFVYNYTHVSDNNYILYLVQIIRCGLLIKTFATPSNLCKLL